MGVVTAADGKIYAIGGAVGPNINVAEVLQ
jgi:hypothetical protein